MITEAPPQTTPWWNWPATTPFRTMPTPPPYRKEQIQMRQMGARATAPTPVKEEYAGEEEKMGPSQPAKEWDGH